jgi:hypothetical protein
VIELSEREWFKKRMEVWLRDHAQASDIEMLINLLNEWRLQNERVEPDI